MQARSDDDGIVHQLGFYEDARGFTTWQSPWKGRCLFSPDKHTLKCEHYRNDATVGSPSATICELKFNLPGLASSKKLRRSIVEQREGMGKGTSHMTLFERDIRKLGLHHTHAH